MNPNKIEIQNPEWLSEALPEILKQLKLCGNQNFPEVLRGRFIVYGCMRLLRCVYGSDLETVAALRHIVMDDVAFWQRIDAMTPAQVREFFAEEERRLRELCSDCPPIGYPTDSTRCEGCPRRGGAE